MTEPIRKAVLVVDDDPEWLQLFVELLKSDYEVIPTETYTEALHVLHTRKPLFHVVITDLRLEDAASNVDGLRLVAEINRMGGVTKAIVVTAHPSLETQAKAFRDLGVFDFLTKHPDNQAFDHHGFLTRVSKAAREAETRRGGFAFVLMPIAARFRKLYERVLRKTLEDNGLVCKRADDFFKPGWLMDDVNVSIRRAGLLVADLSGRNPNVFYELGIAHAKHKPVLLLTQNIDDVPAKLRSARLIVYAPTAEGLRRLRQTLTATIKVLRQGGFSSKPLFPRKKFAQDRHACFVILPRGRSSNTWVKIAIEAAGEARGLDCTSAQSVFSTNRAMNQIWEHIHRARVVVADLSGKDPEVFYLVGLCHGLNKDVILLAHKEKDIPADLRGPSSIVYGGHSRQATWLKDELVSAMEQTTTKRSTKRPAADSVDRPGTNSQLALRTLAIRELKEAVDFGIITIREDEFRAVLDRFVPEFNVQGQRFYGIAHLTMDSSQRCTVAIARCVEQGEGEAQDITRDMISDLKPKWLLLVGIAGGVPASEYTLGDVVVATRIHDFTREAVLDKRPTEYDVAGGPSHRDVQNLLSHLPALEPRLQGWASEQSVSMLKPTVTLSKKSLYGPKAWQAKVKGSLAEHFGPTSQSRPPKVVAGAIASSDRLIKQVELMRALLSSARSILAVEMEAAGVYRAAHRSNREYPLLVIRGISDIIGLQRNLEWTAYACHAAATFAYRLVKSGLIGPKKRRRR